MNYKKILAIIAVVLLVAMYVITLFMAIFDRSELTSWFKTSLFCTAFVPIMLWLMIQVAEWVKKHNEN